MFDMGDYIISCCSTADLTEEHFRSRDIHYICFHYELDGKQYPDDAASESTMHTLRCGYFSSKIVFAIIAELTTPVIPEDRQTCRMSFPSFKNGSK